jgi:hypothetical protein
MIAAIAPPITPNTVGFTHSSTFIAKSPTSCFEALSGIPHVEPSQMVEGDSKSTQMVEGDSKSTDVQSACVLRPPLWLVHLVNRQKGGRAGENEAHDRRAICQLPNLASSTHAGVRRGPAAFYQKADVGN